MSERNSNGAVSDQRAPLYVSSAPGEGMTSMRGVSSASLATGVSIESCHCTEAPFAASAGAV